MSDSPYEFFSEIHHYSLEAKVAALRKLLTAELAALTAENDRLATGSSSMEKEIPELRHKLAATSERLATAERERDEALNRFNVFADDRERLRQLEVDATTRVRELEAQVAAKDAALRTIISDRDARASILATARKALSSSVSEPKAP